MSLALVEGNVFARALLLLSCVKPHIQMTDLQHKVNSDREIVSVHHQFVMSSMVVILLGSHRVLHHSATIDILCNLDSKATVWIEIPGIFEDRWMTAHCTTIDQPSMIGHPTRIDLPSMTIAVVLIINALLLILAIDAGLQNLCVEVEEHLRLISTRVNLLDFGMMTLTGLVHLSIRIFDGTWR